MVGRSGPQILAGRFELLEEVGAGGMGSVWRAYDHELGGDVAVKLLHEARGEAIANLKNEFRVLRTVQHPNLVRLGELYSHDPWFFSMELIDGVGLRDWIAGGPVAAAEREDPPTVRDAPGALRSTDTVWDATRAAFRKRFDEGRLRGALGQLADGLGALEAAGIIHRDLKPSNVMVTRAGRVVVLDFGVAVPSAAEATTELVVGTVEFMAPEQLRGEPLTSAADRYALGALLYDLLVGRPPFTGTLMEIFHRKQDTLPRPPRALFHELPADLDELCMRLLARRPTDRATLDDVRRVTEGHPPSTRRGGVRRQVQLPFVERTSELERVDAAIERVEAIGRCGVVLIHGMPGTGRSRVLEEVGRRASGAGRLVLSGRCLEHEEIRFKAVDSAVDALSRYLSSLPEASRALLLGPEAVATARLFPVLERIVPTDGSWHHETVASLEQEGLRGLAAIFGRLSQQRALVITIDDLQWSNAESFEAFLSVMIGPTAPRLAFVGAVRTAPGSSAMFRARITEMVRRGVSADNVVLTPLSTAACKILARHLLGSASPSADEIAEGCLGIPARLEELAAAATEGLAVADTETLIVARLRARPVIEQSIVDLVAIAIGPVRNEVIAAACGLSYADFMPSLDALRVAGLLHGTGLRREDVTEPARDEVRLATKAHLSAAPIAALHLRLAGCLADHRGSALLIATHARLAGEIPLAVTHLRRCIENHGSPRVLTEVTRACEQMLATPLADALHGSLLETCAEAHARLGELARAAEMLLAAIERGGDEGAERRRRAVELLLQVGRIQDGLAIARQLAGEEGVSLVGSPTAAIVGMGVERARLALRGLVPAPRDVRHADRRGRRADTCHTLSVGLAMVDFLRAGMLQTRATRHALDSGDPMRSARALALEACFQATRGTRSQRRVDQLIRAAETLAGPEPGAAIAGYLASAHGIAAQFRGDYAVAVPACDRAAEHFVLAGRHAWEVTLVRQISLWSLGWQGRWDELARRVAVLREPAARNDDRLTTTYLAIGLTVCGDLANDQADLARGRLDEAMAAWGEDDAMQTPQLHALMGRATLDLYEGLAPQAFHRLEDLWPRVVASHRLRVEQLAATLGELRVRAAIALSAWDPVRHQTARRLLRELPAVQWLAGPVATAHAALAALGGNLEEAARQLEVAVRACDEHQLPLRSAAARARLGALTGGAAGRAAFERAHQDVRALGIRAPAAAITLVAPWPAAQRLQW